ncbi:CHASE domain-containing protein [Vibrio mexicanus]|uniref:CHASE domain-containing protein n=1 Tax=Vibrio mexicanus TaxID=1004326 RepID=UPI000A794671|nr:CHASE domain-containing protein [Vibrio mexicanus]
MTPAPQANDDLPYFLSQASLPVLYVSPRFEGSDYLGHRFELSEGEAQAMARAYETKRVASVATQIDEQPGFRLYLPSFNNDGSLAGFVVGNIVIHELLGITWSEQINSRQFGIKVTTTDDQTIFHTHVSTELSENNWLERVATYENRANIELFNSQWQFEISVLDDSTSILLYGGSAVTLILLLTFSGSLAIDFYATRLKVSDQVIEEKTKTLAKQAVQDTLTGMLNRQALTSEVNERIRQLH